MEIQRVSKREAQLLLIGFSIIFFFVILYKYNKGEPSSSSNLSESSRLVRRQERVVGLPSDNWTPPKVPAHLQNADQNNEELIQHIRDHWIIRPYPAGEWVLYNQSKVHYSQIGQSEAVDKALGGKTEGFFIECGAGDGQFLSNTLFFEKYREWTGLLVEVDPNWFSKILRVRRHSYMINACLSPVKHPVMLNYTEAKLMGGLDKYMAKSHLKEISEKDMISRTFKVQCFPLLSILKAIGVRDVDYFSLDVEGPEVDILQTIPYEDINIGTLTVEFRVNGDNRATRSKLQVIRNLLIRHKGYREVGILSNLDILLQKP